MGEEGIKVYGSNVVQRFLLFSLIFANFSRQRKSRKVRQNAKLLNKNEVESGLSIDFDRIGLLNTKQATHMGGGDVYY